MKQRAIQSLQRMLLSVMLSILMYTIINFLLVKMSFWKYLIIEFIVILTYKFYTFVVTDKLSNNYEREDSLD
jgi:hypothetical protein